MEKVELRFLRITYSHTHAGAYALILSEHRKQNCKTTKRLKLNAFMC